MTSSAELKQMSQAVSDFIEAAEAYSQDRTNAALKRRVAETAGRCWNVGEVTNTLQVYTAPPAAGGASVVYEPITSWDAQIDPFIDQLQIAIDSAYQSLGVLAGMAENAERRERSMAGRVARFFGFPSRVRKLMADSGLPSTTQTVGYIGTIVAQVLATVVGGLILAWVVAVVSAG